MGAKAQAYALALITEEMCEAGCHIGRAQRFGLDTKGEDGVTEREGLERELGDMQASIEYAIHAGLVRGNLVRARASLKLTKLLSPDSRDNLGRRLAPDPST